MAEAFAIASEVTGAVRVGPFGHVEDDLVFPRAIENHGRALAPFASRVQNLAGGVTREEVPEMRFAVARTDKGAVAGDHGDRNIELLRDGLGEREAAAGDEN